MRERRQAPERAALAGRRRLLLVALAGPGCRGVSPLLARLLQRCHQGSPVGAPFPGVGRAIPQPWLRPGRDTASGRAGGDQGAQRAAGWPAALALPMAPRHGLHADAAGTLPLFYPRRALKRLSLSLSPAPASLARSPTASPALWLLPPSLPPVVAAAAPAPASLFLPRPARGAERGPPGRNPGASEASRVEATGGWAWEEPEAAPAGGGDASGAPGRLIPGGSSLLPRLEFPAGICLAPSLSFPIRAGLSLDVTNAASARDSAPGREGVGRLQSIPGGLASPPSLADGEIRDLSLLTSRAKNSPSN